MWTGVIFPFTANFPIVAKIRKVKIKKMTENSRKVSSESAHSDTVNFGTDDSNRAEHFKYCRFIRQVCQRVEGLSRFNWRWRS